MSKNPVEDARVDYELNMLIVRLQRYRRRLNEEKKRVDLNAEKPFDRLKTVLPVDVKKRILKAYDAIFVDQHGHKKIADDVVAMVYSGVYDDVQAIREAFDAWSANKFSKYEQLIKDSEIARQALENLSAAMTAAGYENVDDQLTFILNDGKLTIALEITSYTLQLLEKVAIKPTTIRQKLEKYPEHLIG
jgi:hypothetical protein